nr:hypothetical protein [Tanacetum cinerariifolium]
KINISRNVVFDEDTCWNWDYQKAPFKSQGEEFITDVQDIPSSIRTSTSPSWLVSSSPTSSPTSPVVSSLVTNNNNTTTEVTESVQLRRSERRRVPRRRFQIKGEASSSQQAQDELSAIQKNKTWELVDLPAGKYPIGLKWVFKTKYLADGSIQKHKARSIVKGYAQQHGIDYENPSHRSQNEPTLYVKRKGTDLLIVSLYVDDMIYASSSSHLIYEFQSSMKKMFDMTDLRELRYFLGLEIIQGSGGIFMTQRLTDAKICRSLVGRLIYVTHSRPDVAYSVGVLSKHEKFILKGYCDSDWAGSIEDRQSTTKHMEIKHHYIRELIAKGEVRLESYRTNEQVADLLTKALPQVKHDEFKAHLGVS